MGKLRTALRVVTDKGLIVLGLATYLIGQPVAAGVIIPVGSYFLRDGGGRANIERPHSSGASTSNETDYHAHEAAQ